MSCFSAFSGSFFSSLLRAEDPLEKPWEEKHTRLANQYLGLLIEDPDYGNIVELLWDLYTDHGASRLLLENLATQAAASGDAVPHLIHGHLLRESGDAEAAAKAYAEAARHAPDSPRVLRARSQIADVPGR